MLQEWITERESCSIKMAVKEWKVIMLEVKFEPNTNIIIEEIVDSAHVDTDRQSEPSEPTTTGEDSSCAEDGMAPEEVR